MKVSCTIGTEKGRLLGCNVVQFLLHDFCHSGCCVSLAHSFFFSLRMDSTTAMGGTLGMKSVTFT
jgi:hypothetical protein